MKHSIVFGILLGIGLTAEASQIVPFKFNARAFSTTEVTAAGVKFKKFNWPQTDLERSVGSPELPVKTFLVKGNPQNINAQLIAEATRTIEGRPMPVQEQDCRCETKTIKKFAYASSKYDNASPEIEISYLGQYRGQPLSQVVVRLGRYDSAKNEMKIVTSGEIKINADQFELAASDLKDYLIVGNQYLLEGAADFIKWKQSQGYNVYTEVIASPNNTTAAIANIIKNQYTTNGIDFVILLGDETSLPMFKVPTSGSSQTPSDLKYFTMDGAQDFIPEMFASRIAARNASQVSAQLAKSIEYEQKSYGSVSGLNKFIGVASNEGSNPSDDEYVKAIGAKYKEVMKSDVHHLWENDAVKSNPTYFNSQLNDGAMWVTYLGHGSGFSWPSFNVTYSTSHVKQVTNKSQVKPVIIDVACQNGKLEIGYLGTELMAADPSNGSLSFGAVAYYGGTVNISWHPPAVMAQGITFEQLAKNYKHLGEALLAGQLYLSSKWNNKNEVIDNFEWYHLQGDPGLRIGQ